MADFEDVFLLVKAKARLIASLHERDREEALNGLHGLHEKSALQAGMSEAAALEMANRFDTWIREALKLRPDAPLREQTVH